MSAMPNEPILFARLPEGIVVIRVHGRGTHAQSASLRKVFELTREETPPVRYVIDLDHCVTMDSTFLGTLASIAIHQRQRQGSPMVAVNINDHVRNLMETLGLKYLMDLRAGRGNVLPPVADVAFTPAPKPDLNKMDQIIMMLEAHEQLVDVDSRNEVKFEGVLKALHDSLDRERSRL